MQQYTLLVERPNRRTKKKVAGVLALTVDDIHDAVARALRLEEQLEERRLSLELEYLDDEHGWLEVPEYLEGVPVVCQLRIANAENLKDPGDPVFGVVVDGPPSRARRVDNPPPDVPDVVRKEANDNELWISLPVELRTWIGRLRDATATAREKAAVANKIANACRSDDKLADLVVAAGAAGPFVDMLLSGASSKGDLDLVSSALKTLVSQPKARIDVLERHEKVVCAVVVRLQAFDDKLYSLRPLLELWKLLDDDGDEPYRAAVLASGPDLVEPVLKLVASAAAFSIDPRLSMTKRAKGLPGPPQMTDKQKAHGDRLLLSIRALTLMLADASDAQSAAAPGNHHHHPHKGRWYASGRRRMQHALAKTVIQLAEYELVLEPWRNAVSAQRASRIKGAALSILIDALGGGGMGGAKAESFAGDAADGELATAATATSGGGDENDENDENDDDDENENDDFEFDGEVCSEDDSKCVFRIEPAYNALLRLIHMREGHDNETLDSQLAVTRTLLQNAFQKADNKSTAAIRLVQLVDAAESLTDEHGEEAVNWSIVEHAGETLVGLVKGDEHVCDEIVKNNAITALVGILQGNSPRRARCITARLLTVLARASVRNVERIAETGTIKTLVRLLKTSNREDRRAFVGLLVCLAITPKNLDHIAAEDGIDVIVPFVIRPYHNDTDRDSIDLLWHFVKYKPEFKAKILKYKGIIRGLESIREEADFTSNRMKAAALLNLLEDPVTAPCPTLAPGAVANQVAATSCKCAIS